VYIHIYYAGRKNVRGRKGFSRSLENYYFRAHTHTAVTWLLAVYIHTQTFCTPLINIKARLYIYIYIRQVCVFGRVHKYISRSKNGNPVNCSTAHSTASPYIYIYALYIPIHESAKCTTAYNYIYVYLYIPVCMMDARHRRLRVYDARTSVVVRVFIFVVHARALSAAQSHERTPTLVSISSCVHVIRILFVLLRRFSLTTAAIARIIYIYSAHAYRHQHDYRD